MGVFTAVVVGAAVVVVAGADLEQAAIDASTTTTNIKQNSNVNLDRFISCLPIIFYLSVLHFACMLFTLLTSFRLAAASFNLVLRAAVINKTFFCSALKCVL
jgi:hypothetical protein